MPRSPTSVAAARSSRCAKRSTPQRTPTPRPREDAMQMNRRTFIIGSAAVGGGLALGLRLPFGPDVARAQDGSPEVAVWVATAPADTVKIRDVCSEMGQGTVPGLPKHFAAAHA